MIGPVRGTHDWLDTSLFNFVIATAAHHFKRANFSEIKTPVLEPTELFKRSLGLHTDVVSKEMFTIASHDESDSICLRPEATASVMRAFLAAGQQSLPWKVFVHGPMFRHERPQKGRFREFHQFNLELIGAESIAHDAFTLALFEQLFSQQFKLDSYALLINFLGCADDRAQLRPKLNAFLDMHFDTLCATCKVRKEKNVMRIFDCKNEQCKSLYQTAPYITDHLCVSCEKEWHELKVQLEILAVSYTHTPSLVRGLDYYDKTVFEFVSSALGSQNAFCSGGRYNALATMLGSKTDYPSFGAAIGIDRVALMLEPLRAKLALPQPAAIHAIIPLSSAQHHLALLIADLLFDAGLTVELIVDGDSIKSMMRKANKIGAQYAIIIGPDEVEAGTVSVKTMMTGIEEKVVQRDLVSFLKK
jgi:histidyl-tRNA synthetase